MKVKAKYKGGKHILIKKEDIFEVEINDNQVVVNDGCCQIRFHIYILEDFLNDWEVIETINKPSLDRNLICIIHSEEQAKLVFKLNEKEGLTNKERMNELGIYNADMFSYSYCYIGFHRGYWQTLKKEYIIENKKLVTFEQLKELTN